MLSVAQILDNRESAIVKGPQHGRDPIVQSELDLVRALHSTSVRYVLFSADEWLMAYPLVSE
jgi:hypothetical protein